MKSSRFLLMRRNFPILGLVIAALLLSTCQAGNPALAASPEAAAGSNLTFTHEIVDANPPSGGGCCLDVLSIGDIDADGKPDLMLGSENAEGVFWYHNPDWKRYSIGAGNFTTDGEVADVDGDGDGDVVISMISDDKIVWFENTGNPTSGGWQKHVIGDRFSHDLVVYDINGDGNLDVVIFRKDGPRQLTWFEAPDNPRQTWTRHEIATPPGEGLDAGDLDGDGDADIVAGRFIYENTDGTGLKWNVHTISNRWGEDTRAIIADVNNDGKMDIILAHAEGSGRVSWFETPTLTEHPISQGNLEGAHSLEAGDFDGDGQLDVFVGEMHTSSSKRVMIFQNLGGGLNWQPVTLASTGTHNARIADIDADGDLDIVGKNYDGPKKVELWRNATPKGPSLDNWSYIQVDRSREQYIPGTSFFGLAAGDVNNDGLNDLVSGKYVYLNPGGNMSGAWERVTFPINVDAMLILDVDGDEFADVIGEALPDVYWLEAQDAQGKTWNSTKIGTLPQTTHQNGQGYALAQIIPGGKPEILLAAGSNDHEIYYFEIPPNPSAGNWPRTLITDEAIDEGIGVGDVDRDGDLDIASGDMHTGGKYIAWYENPGDGAGEWSKHRLAAFNGVWPDRIYLVDINEDGRLDVLVSEENDGSQANASVYWYEQPANPKSSSWTQHKVTTQYTTNGMDVADMDDDGDLDIITGEHRGTKKVVIWENLGKGADWKAHEVDRGKESHLGARVWDLDNDGDFEIISIAWDDYGYLHLWRSNSGVKLSEPVYLPLIQKLAGLLMIPVSGNQAEEQQDGIGIFSAKNIPWGLLGLIVPGGVIAALVLRGINKRK